MLELADALSADLLFGYRTAESYDEAMFPARCIDLRLPPALRGPGRRLLALSVAFARQRRRAAAYDVRIFSGNAAVFAAPSRTAPGRNIFYCHAPPRFIYDQADFLRRRAGPVVRLGNAAVGDLYRRGYERAVARMHTIVANSENVRRRIQTYLGRDSVVVYPPCDTDGYRWQPDRGYYLSTARLTPLKRVETIVAAFLKMPDKHLVVASGGEESDALRRLAAGAANIRFTGWTSEAELRRLVSESIATIYVPIDEDFGMSPVESMAAGKPCISVAEGGPLETLLADETGYLLRPDFGADDLVAAVRGLTPERAAAMRQACEARAALFSRQAFLSAMRAIIDAGRTA